MRLSEPKEVIFPSGKLNLHGFIHKPEGDGPFRAILINHGSEHPKSGKLIAQPYVDRGYVAFVPHRRGQGRSSDQSEYIMDLIGQEPESTMGRKFVELQETHQKDVTAALSYLKQLPYVDINRIAMVGGSFGGIQSVLSTEKQLGLQGVIAFAPAAMAWSQVPELQLRLIQAVRSATIPILLIQVENDYDLSPTRTMAKELEKVNKPHKLLIFPAFGKTHAEGHAFGVRAVEIWGDAVFAFLESVMP
ncbi:alpha/beta hydrolase family protein [Acaryochloris marina NIES-2412]|uniref:alpha/beta hydrolase family protein n=1 Tax=Acaryochloris marina TaxID=155978 RepID=UPI0040593CBE